jgi:putative hydrolase of the HAD superfamily
MIKAVFFDLYQTLVHYRPTQAELEAEALNSLGFKTPAAALELPILTANEILYKEMAGRPLSKRSREEIAALYTEYQRTVLKEAGIKAEEKVVLKLLAMMQQAHMDLVVYDDALPVLTDIKQRGLVTGLISNIEKNMNETIEKLGIASKLDIIVTSLDAGAAKPQPEIFRYALKKVRVQPSESIYVGDQYQVDMAGAKAAGMQGILLDRVGYYRQKLDCPKIKSLKEIIDYIV